MLPCVSMLACVRTCVVCVCVWVGVCCVREPYLEGAPGKAGAEDDPINWGNAKRVMSNPISGYKIGFNSQRQELEVAWRA